MKPQTPKNDQIQLKDVAMELYKFIITYFMMLNYPEPIINKSQVKIIIWSKDGHNAHF